MRVAELKTIAAYNSQYEAEIARAALESGGISVYITNAASTTMLSHAAAGLEGVQLQVAADDVERARAELASLEGSPETPDWRCARCGHDVDAGFALCWSCGNAFSLDQASVDDEARKEIERDEHIDQPADSAAAAEEQAQHALRASVFGLLIPPVLIYAALLLILLVRAPLSSEGTARYYKACVITALGCIAYYVFYTSAL